VFKEASALRSRTTMRSSLAVPAGLTGLALLAACGGGTGSDDAGGESIELTYAFFAPENTFPAVQMQEWADRLTEETDGQVEVELFTGGELLDAGDIFDGVSEGVADVGLDAPAYDVGRFPVTSVINLPIGLDNAQIASQVLIDLLEENEDAAEFEGFEIITAFTTEPAFLQTVDPIEEMDDLDGAELRSTGAQLPALEALGAAPVGMPMPEVPEAMETGVIEGYITSRETLQDFGLAEQVDYVNDYNFGISSSFVAVMDADRFAELPEDVQDTIHDLRREMTTFASQYHDEENVQPALEWAADEHGVETITLDEDEAEAWDETIATVIEDWIAGAEDQDEAEALLARAEELRDEYSNGDDDEDDEDEDADDEADDDEEED
jgi:TRAP-type transport system periplasmic protein